MHDFLIFLLAAGRCIGSGLILYLEFLAAKYIWKNIKHTASRIYRQQDETEQKEP